MPTPVAVARQCLAPEAASALDEAVVISGRRGHSQTTSLHMVAALLSLPSSRLREACTRARSNACAARAQFKALELSLGVALDRLPSAKVENPPVANSLMAAIKRSQANQRRQPESTGLYQQQCSSVSSSIVKVEIHNLVFSMLDDPSVSRVFGEAGFRGYDLKISTLTLRQGMSYNSSSYKRAFPPLFMCNANNIEIRSRFHRFPFMFGDENSAKIGEVMVRAKKRNPLLLGFSADVALTEFLEALKVGNVLPVGLNGVSVVCVEDEVSRFLNSNDELLLLRLGEVERMFEGGTGQRVVLNLGDLKALATDDVGEDVLRCLLSKLGRLFSDHFGKLWLIGAVASYDVCNRILSRLPSIEEEWDLEILPITSLASLQHASCPKSRFGSLTESFVPFGGFFSMPFDMKGSLLNACRYDTKAEGNGLLEHAELAMLGKQHPYNQPVVEENKCSVNCQVSPNKGFQDVKDGEKTTDNDCRNHSSALTKLCSSNSSNLSENPSKFIRCSGGLEDHHIHHSDAGTNDDQASPNSIASVTTDLCLGIVQSSVCKELEKPVDESHEDFIQDLSSSSLSVNADAIHSGIANSCFRHDSAQFQEPEMLYKYLVERVGHQEAAISTVVEAISHSQSKSDSLRGMSHGGVWMHFQGPDRLSKRKLGLALAEVLYGSTERLIYVDLSFQDEMIQSDAVSSPLILNKYDVNMRGTVVDYLVDKLSKNPGVVFLENINMSDPVVQTSLSRAVKTSRLVDFHGREVNVSHSIFLMTTQFLEGCESLSCSNELAKEMEEYAVRAKSHLMQICVGFDLNDDPGRGSPCQLDNMKTGCPVLLTNKRKVIAYGRNSNSDLHRSWEVTKRAHKASNSPVDLNLPDDSETDSSYQNSTSWLGDFDRQIDHVVVFKPFNFDGMADKLHKDMTDCLHKIIGFKCTLEIESHVIQQLLAAAYVYDSKKVEDWIQCVLGQGFAEAMRKFSLAAHSVVKLVTIDTVQTEGILLLPHRIMIN